MSKPKEFTRETCFYCAKQFDRKVSKKQFKRVFCEIACMRKWMVDPRFKGMHKDAKFAMKMATKVCTYCAKEFEIQATRRPEFRLRRAMGGRFDHFAAGRV